MEQRTWPCGSDGRKVPRAFSALHQTSCSSRYYSRHRYEKNVKWEVEEEKRRERLLRRRREGEGAEEERDFAAMPFDVVRRICGSMTTPNLMAASAVCRAWKEALAPLREAALLLHHGKRLKHGRGGVCRNLDKALDSFLKGANRGSAASMVDAGLLLWEMGRKREGMELYRAAAELGDPAGQCNLGLSYLQAESSNSQEAVKWFYRAAFAGHVRAQYSLALCLQQGRGVERNPVKAVGGLSLPNGILEQQKVVVPVQCTILLYATYLGKALCAIIKRQGNG